MSCMLGTSHHNPTSVKPMNRTNPLMPWIIYVALLDVYHGWSLGLAYHDIKHSIRNKLSLNRCHKLNLKNRTPNLLFLDQPTIELIKGSLEGSFGIISYIHIVSSTSPKSKFMWYICILKEGDTICTLCSLQVIWVMIDHLNVSAREELLFFFP